MWCIFVVVVVPLNLTQSQAHARDSREARESSTVVTWVPPLSPVPWNVQGCKLVTGISCLTDTLVNIKRLRQLE